jgi:hypothetical protein
MVGVSAFGNRGGEARAKLDIESVLARVRITSTTALILDLLGMVASCFQKKHHTPGVSVGKMPR